jgi:hypothetical protein
MTRGWACDWLTVECCSRSYGWMGRPEGEGVWLDLRFARRRIMYSPPRTDAKLAGESSAVPRSTTTSNQPLPIHIPHPTYHHRRVLPLPLPGAGVASTFSFFFHLELFCRERAQLNVAVFEHMLTPDLNAVA